MTDDRFPDLGGFIKAQRELARLSVRALSDLTGVSNPYLSQIERGLRKPSAEVLQQIARGLRVSAESLYVRAGILDPESTERSGVVEAIEADPHLATDQKRSLLAVYRSFREQSGSTPG